jgi:hypothetical protein
VEYYNNQRYHESLDNLKRMGGYTGRAKEVLAKQAGIKKLTLHSRRKQREYNNLGSGKYLFVRTWFCPKCSEDVNSN